MLVRLLEVRPTTITPLVALLAAYLVKMRLRDSNYQCAGTENKTWLSPDPSQGSSQLLPVLIVHCTSVHSSWPYTISSRKTLTDCRIIENNYHWLGILFHEPWKALQFILYIAMHLQSIIVGCKFPHVTGLPLSISISRFINRKIKFSFPNSSKFCCNCMDQFKYIIFNGQFLQYSFSLAI